MIYKLMKVVAKMGPFKWVALCLILLIVALVAIDWSAGGANAGHGDGAGRVRQGDDL